MMKSVSTLSSFAVATRYPGKNATNREATSSRRWAGKFRTEGRTLLKI